MKRICVPREQVKSSKIKKVSSSASFSDFSSATQLGWVKSVRVLLNHSITRILDRNNFNPLHYAASASEDMFSESLEVTNLLLDHGLDIDPVWNCDINHPAFGHYVYPKATPTVLSIAIWYGNVGLTALLLERGANIEIRNIRGFTPLMFLMKRLNSYEDSMLEELVSILLFYNVDVFWWFNTYPLYKAACYGKEFICNLLTCHYVEYHLQDFVEQDSFNYKYTEDIGVSAVFNCVHNKFHVDTIIDVADRLNFTTYGLLESLLEAGQLENPKLFNHLYHKLKLRDIEMEDCKDLGLRKKLKLRDMLIEDCGYVGLRRFFAFSEFNKIDFMSAIEKLLDIELDIKWDLLDFSFSYLELFKKAKPRLNFELENITDDFEIFLKSGIRVLGIDPIYVDFLAFFGQILFPYKQPVAGPPKKVNSLLILARDVIRRHLQPRVQIA